MKATMTLEDDRSWKLSIRAETAVEQDIIEAANKGMDVKCQAYGSPDEQGVIVITGSAARYLGTASPDGKEKT